MWEYGRRKNGQAKRKIAFVHPAPMGHVCFASGKTGAAGYVKERETVCTCSTACKCKGDSPLLGNRYAEFQVYITRRLGKVETQPN